VKIVFNMLGSVFVMIGVLGMFLPLLPTTPFLLLASACYIRGSEKLHSWLMNNRFLGPYIRNFREKRGMPLSAKIATLILFWGSISISIWRIDIPALQMTLAVVGVFVTVLILRIKTLRESTSSDPSNG
jgi:uncharacterized membrane protein YbaN (DUF454 family)